ncbi:uncharacterized protein LOC124933474 isoform X1 [Impatiens glandulifera]|uniref:uncharacterized protein LOC124933474 isoform X1 n=1 Tax=Impatiens glandulifera TaxID=253017 RepID=UPI001FB18F78|nr:uncharacterized protein LOC124933474 isoform X1 [Impatiens glandulifera]
MNDKCGGGKREGSESKVDASSSSSTFEVNDLVFFGRSDFGVAVGTEKDDPINVYGLEILLFVLVVNYSLILLVANFEGRFCKTNCDDLDASQLKRGSFDRKFTTLDNYCLNVKFVFHLMVLSFDP